MTIPVSTVPAAQAALLAAIQAQVATDNTPQDILVAWGDPSIAAPPVLISLGEVRRRPERMAFVGDGARNYLEEAYDLDVEVSVAMETQPGTDDTTTLIDRTWQIVAYIETAVRTDPSLAGTVLEAYPNATTGGRPDWAENGIGRICELTLTVFCQAVI